MAMGLSVASTMLAAPLAAPVAAQQTIINAPSVDQTPRGRWFALHESQVRAWGRERTWQTTHFVTYGVTDRVEAALTVYNVGTPLKRYAAIGAGWKTAQPLPVLAQRWSRWEPVLGAGQMLTLPLRGERTGMWSFAQASARVPRLSTRLTGGISSGPPALFGAATTHFVGSVEQPLSALPTVLGHRLHHVTALAEWWSGRHELADLVVGASYHRHGTVVIAGYKRGNGPDRSGDALVFEIGRTF